MERTIHSRTDRRPIDTGTARMGDRHELRALKAPVRRMDRCEIFEINHLHVISQVSDELPEPAGWGRVTSDGGVHAWR